MTTNPWHFLVTVQGWAGQTPAVALCFPKPGHFKNKDVERAFVAKYEITLDECLAWTKAKSRSFYCAVNFLFLWKKKYLSDFLSDFWYFAMQSTQRNPEWITKGFLFCSTLLFSLLSELGFHRKGLFFFCVFFSSLQPRSNHLLTAVESDFAGVYTQIWNDETAAALTEKCRIPEMSFKIILCLLKACLSSTME